MKTIVIGDYNTLIGIPEKNQPGKVAWLREKGIHVDGAQIISLAPDLLPGNLEGYGQKLLDLVDKIGDLKRLSVALLCWPHIKKTDEQKTVVDVAVSTMLAEDLYTYALFVCKALQAIHDVCDIMVDISYHPMLTVPTRLIPQLDVDIHQDFLWECEITRRKEFRKLLKHYGIRNVNISIENEPVTSDQWGNLTHSGNRLFSEQVHKLPEDWGVTADIQHLAMILHCLNNPDKYQLAFEPFDPYSFNSVAWSWDAQIDRLRLMEGEITFHIAQMGDPMRHVTPPLRFNDPVMDWPLILRRIKKLDEYRGGNVWYAVEQDGGHNWPEGYEMDLKAFQYLQDYFTSSSA